MDDWQKTIIDKLDRLNAGQAALKESVKFVGEEVRTRTNVIFDKLNEHSKRIRTAETNIALLQDANSSKRLKILESWQAKWIGAAAMLLLIANLTISIWRSFK